MMMNYVIMTMILTHQTAGDAEPDPRVPHSPQMKSAHPPQMKAPLFLAKADIRFWFVRHGLIGFVHAGEFQNCL